MSTSSEVEGIFFLRASEEEYGSKENFSMLIDKARSCAIALLN